MIEKHTYFNGNRYYIQDYYMSFVKKIMGWSEYYLNNYMIENYNAIDDVGGLVYYKNIDDANRAQEWIVSLQVAEKLRKYS